SVVSRLREMDYFITSVSEKRGNILFSNKINLFQGIKLRDLTIFYRQFATMVNAGLTLVNSLDILIKQVENKALSNIIAAYFIILFNRTSKSVARVNSKEILFKAFNCNICDFSFSKLFPSF
ncbi:unnamed protein product, partial [marine sediment metagenome]